MKIFKIIFGAILCFSIIFTFAFGYKKIDEGHYFGTAEEYKGIITIWQVDSFEGGVGSRKQFLLKVAREFEKQNPGVLVMVVDRTPESVKESMAKGEAPDMVSFGVGVSVSNFIELKDLTGNKGGNVGDKTCAIPWCRGGYVLIANPKLTSEIPNEIETLLISQGEYNLSTTAVAIEGIKVKNATVKKPMDAYVQFVEGKTPYFLGTQRDIHRLERRGFEVITKPIIKYNDLYQYISVTTSNTLKSYYSEKFIELLVSESVQKSLSDIGMLGVSEKVEYQNPHLIKMQDVVCEQTISAFIQKEKLQNLSEDSLAFLLGEKEREIKIKNMLI